VTNCGFARRRESLAQNKAKSKACERKMYTPKRKFMHTCAREKTISISWTMLDMERKIKDNDNDKTKKNITDE